MLNCGVQSATWVLGMLMVLSCCVSAPGASAEMGVSEAYSQNDTSTTVYSSDNYLRCTIDQQVTVSSTQEVSDLIKRYTNSRSDEAVRIRATHRRFHSSNGLVCPGQRGSSYAEYQKVNPADDSLTSIMVLINTMNKVVSVDSKRHLVTVEAGMSLRELALAAEAHSMSVPAGSFTPYANLTVAGVVLTSAHSTAYRKSSSLGDLVRKVREHSHLKWSRSDSCGFEVRDVFTTWSIHFMRRHLRCHVSLLKLFLFIYHLIYYA